MVCGRGLPPGNGFRKGERSETLRRLRTTLRSLERGTLSGKAFQEEECFPEMVSGKRNAFCKRFLGRTLSRNGFWEEEHFPEKSSPRLPPHLHIYIAIKITIIR